MSPLRVFQFVRQLTPISSRPPLRFLSGYLAILQLSCECLRLDFSFFQILPTNELCKCACRLFTLNITLSPKQLQHLFNFCYANFESCCVFYKLNYAHTHRNTHRAHEVYLYICFIKNENNTLTGEFYISQDW